MYLIFFRAASPWCKRGNRKCTTLKDLEMSYLAGLNTGNMRPHSSLSCLAVLPLLRSGLSDRDDLAHED